MPDTNTMYYTFSTIAQTLSGAIALLGAFVLYRLQTINASLDVEIAGLLAVYRSNTHLQNKYYDSILPAQLVKDYRVFINHVNNTEVKQFLKTIYQNSSDNPFENRSASLNHLWANRTEILQGLGRALLLTIVVIISSVLLINITPIIQKCYYLNILVCFSAIFALAVSYSGWIIWKGVKN